MRKVCPHCGKTLKKSVIPPYVFQCMDCDEDFFNFETRTRLEKIYCIVGPSGVGKTTICDELSRKYGLTQVVSYTDRPRRTADEQGHIFVTEEQFNKLRDEMVAYKRFCGHQYGATRQQVLHSDLYVIDPDGLEDLTQNFHEKGIVAIGLVAPNSVLEKRMSDRGDDSEKVQQRIENDKQAFAGFEKSCNKIINTNGKTIAAICEEIKRFILEEEKK